MEPVAIFLLSVAAIFLIGALGEIIFQRTNIPDVVWLILAGILIGPVSGIVTPEQLNQIAPFFAAITLVVVLFEGGSALKLSELAHAAPRSSVLAIIGFLLSALCVALLSMLAALVGILPDSWTLMHGVLLGVILGGSSSIIIMPAMAQARVEPKVANLVNLESALTDALCVVGTSALIDVMTGGSTGAAAPAISLFKSMGIGLAIGLVVGLFWLLLLRFLHSHEHAYPVTLSALLMLYVLIDHLGGSAALGILTVAIILGNASSLSQKIGLVHGAELDTSVRGFHRQMAFIIKSFFFVFIGAMLGPPLGPIVFGVLLCGALIAARIPAVKLALLGTDLGADQKKLVTISMPRGMAAGVLATLPVSAGVVGTESLPVAVFSCVVCTIAVFAVGFKLVKAKTQSGAADDYEEIPLPAGAARPSMTGNYRVPVGETPTHQPATSPGAAGAAAPAAAVSPADPPAFGGVPPAARAPADRGPDDSNA